MPVNKIKSRAAFRNWYERNKANHNTKRKDRYHTDPEYREKVLETQQRYRESVSAEKQVEGGVLKKVGGKMVPAYRVSVVAERIERTIQVIRIWERDKKIPKPSIPGAHRYYTEGQIQLLVEFAAVMSEVRYSPKERADAVAAKSKELFEKWKKA